MRLERLKILLSVVILVSILLVVRVFHTMIIAGSSLRTQADENRFWHKLIFPPRGIIFDRHHVPLVENTVMYARITGDPFAIHPTFEPINEHEALNELIVRPEVVERFSQRFYPFGNALAHVVGYVGYGSARSKVGQTGLERIFQTDLAGGTGIEQYEMNATGKLTRLVHVEEPPLGKDISVSIDAELSKKAADLMAGRKGAVIVSEIENSELLVLLSSPGFDPANVSGVLNAPDKPLLNRALSAYPPGSVFKMMTALAALKSGTIHADTLVRDEGELKVGEAVFRNWYFSSYGRTEGEISMVRALSRSNDIFFYKIAGLIGPDAIASMAKLFHLGEKTGIELPGEQAGLIPTPAWKEQVVGEKWYLGDTYHMGIGQGDVLVTPLQLNAMTAALARRGIWCKPTLLLSPPICEDLGLAKEDLKTVVSGMRDACSTGGTAFPFFAYNALQGEAQKIACKTGTAEHGGKDEKGNRATHAWFTMFYPLLSPRIAITVLLESEASAPYLEGSADAAPIAKAIWEFWLQSKP